MKVLFDFGQQRTFAQAAVFYVCHLLIAVLSAGLAGMLAGAHAQPVAVHSAASLAGQLVALVYSAAVCVAVIARRGLSGGYYAALLLVLPVAFLLGGFGGLLIPAVLTTRSGAKAGAILAVRDKVERTFAAPRTDFGRRSPTTR